MSLIIHTIVKGGLVVSVDTRTTCKDDKGNTRYNDTAEKLIPFPNRIVVTHSGDATVTDKLTVTDFLLQFRKKCGKKTMMAELPLKLLNEYISACNGHCKDTYFKVSGYDEVNMLRCRTYTIKTKDKQIVLSRNPFDYGASFDGAIDMAYSLMNGATYANMSLVEAIDLTNVAMIASIDAYKYQPAQIIGGNIKTYVIDISNDESGWLIDNQLVADKNAPDDAIQQYREQQTKRLIQQMNKQKSKKGTN